MANAGQALIAAANALLGKGFTPVVSLSPTSPGITVGELVKDYLQSRALKGRSDRYLRQLRVVLRSFSHGRNRATITAVTVPDIEKWLHGNDWGNYTMKNYLADVRTMFNWAVKRGHIERNPAAGVDVPVCRRTREIHVHTPAEVRQVLETARRVNLDVCRLLAIRYFAGVRDEEVHKLRESHIKLDQGLIEIAADISKTRSRRLVTIEPNLRAWLALGGELRPMSRDTVREVIKLSKVEWKPNAPRHSYVSNHLYISNSAAKTALEAGHTEQILFKNYRAIVTPAAAAEFWSIRPLVNRAGGLQGPPAGNRSK